MRGKILLLLAVLSLSLESQKHRDQIWMLYSHSSCSCQVFFLLSGLLSPVIFFPKYYCYSLRSLAITPLTEYFNIYMCVYIYNICIYIYIKGGKVVFQEPLQNASEKADVGCKCCSLAWMLSAINLLMIN